MSTPAPPYKLSELSTPLTATQRTQIVKWCQIAAVSESLAGWHGSTLPANLADLPDDQLLVYYKAEAAIQGFNIPGVDLNPKNALSDAGIQSPLTSINQFLGGLTNPNLWLRISEFGIGAILVAVGLNAVLRPGRSISSAIPKV